MVEYNMAASQQRQRVYCSVYGCLNSTVIKPILSFFQLPADARRRSEWLRLISREDLSHKSPQCYRVCEEHFNELDILPGTQRKKLKNYALPSLNLPDLILQKKKDVETQTIISTQECKSSEMQRQVVTSGRVSNVSIDDPKRRKVLGPEGRQIVLNVYKFLQEEYEFMVAFNHDKCDLTPLRKLRQRTADAVGVGKDTVTRILNEDKLKYLTPKSSQDYSSKGFIRISPKKSIQKETEVTEIKEIIDPKNPKKKNINTGNNLDNSFNNEAKTENEDKEIILRKRIFEVGTEKPDPPTLTGLELENNDLEMCDSTPLRNLGQRTADVGVSKSTVTRISSKDKINFTSESSHDYTLNKRIRKEAEATEIKEIIDSNRNPTINLKNFAATSKKSYSRKNKNEDTNSGHNSDNILNNEVKTENEDKEILRKLIFEVGTEEPDQSTLTGLEYIDLEIKQEEEENIVIKQEEEENIVIKQEQEANTAFGHQMKPEKEEAIKDQIKQEKEKKVINSRIGQKEVKRVMIGTWPYTQETVEKKKAKLIIEDPSKMF